MSSISRCGLKESSKLIPLKQSWLKRLGSVLAVLQVKHSYHLVLNVIISLLQPLQLALFLPSPLFESLKSYLNASQSLTLLQMLRLQASGLWESRKFIPLIEPCLEVRVCPGDHSGITLSFHFKSNIIIFATIPLKEARLEKRACPGRLSGGTVSSSSTTMAASVCLPTQLSSGLTSLQF